MSKVTIITNIPNPYRIPLFNEMKNRLNYKNYTLRVIFGDWGYARRKWEIDENECRFEFSVLKSRKVRIGDSEKVMFLYNGLIRDLLKNPPGILIVGGFSMATLKICLLSFFKPVKYIIWSGSTRVPGKKTSALREKFRRMLMRRASGYVAYGNRAKAYLVSLGASPEDVRIGINTSDTTFFAEKTAEIRRGFHGIKSRNHLTYIGYLVPRKNVIKVLRAVKALLKFRNDFVLDIVGDGEDRERLQKFVMEENLGEYVIFHGYKQKGDIPDFLAVSDCFLFQTEFDIWGLVLNEAMAAGVPCLASIHAGSTDDLIKEGETGFIADFDDSEQTATRISWILDHKDEMEILGQKAARFISETCSVKHSAQGFVNAVEAVD